MLSSRPALRALLLAACVAAAPQHAAAAVFRVFPVTLQAPAEAPAAALTLTNASEAPARLQIRVCRWTQVDGRDVMVPTSDVIASPPAAAVDPGGSRLVRVVRTAKTEVSGEESYRLLIDEIPDPRQETGSGIRLLLRQSIPVFFGGGVKARVEWRMARSSAGWDLIATNHGAQRQRISDLTIKDKSGRVIARRAGLVGYVLGASQIRWPLDLAEATPASIAATSDAGPIQADVGVAPPL